MDDELEELDELETGGLVAGLGVEAGAGALNAELDESPGALDRVAPPPLATARAAAASAALVPGRDGAALLEDGDAVVELEDAEVGGGATGRVFSCGVAGRPEPPDEEDPGRLLLDPDELLEPDDGREVLGPVNDGGREDDVDVGLAAGGAAGVGAADRAGRAPPRPGGGVGREDWDDDGFDRPLFDPEELDDDGGVNADGGLVAGAAALVTGAVGGVAELSGRDETGRARVVSSAAPSFLSFESLDVTLGDASVVIGTVPPPGFCRDVLSDRWPLSELTSHLHAQAADRGTKHRMIPCANRLASAKKVHRTPLFGRY